MKYYKSIFLNLICAIVLSILSIFVIERLFSLMTSDLILSCLKTLRSHINLKNDVIKNVYIIISRVAISTDTLMVTLVIGLTFAELVKKYGLKLYFWCSYLTIYALPLFQSLANAINDKNVINVFGIIIICILMVVSLLIGLMLNKFLKDISSKITGTH